MINYLSMAVIPLIITAIVASGLMNKINIFDEFTVGAKEGLETSVRILPSIIGLMCAVAMLRASGVIDYICGVLSPILSFLQFPKELVPLAIMRPISGSASLAVINDIIKTNGADSLAGRCASVMAGSTETTFYTLAVYLGSVGITKSRYTVKAALLADITAMAASVVLVRLMLY